MESKIIEKLSKLLRMAASNSEHEANLAMERALELAMKHGIELSSVSLDADKRDEKVTSTTINNEPYKGERKEIMRLLVAHFNVGISYDKKRGCIHIYGAPDDKEFAMYLYGYLKHQYQFLWKLKKMGGGTNSNDYYTGLTAGICIRLRAIESKNQAWGLIVRDKKAAITSAMTPYIGKAEKEKFRQPGVDFMAGMGDSSKVNLNRPVGDSAPRAGYIS